MTPEKKKEWQAHIKIWRKYVRETSAWLKEQDAPVTNAGPETPPPTPPGSDNPPGKPPNP